jgi:antitoxin (DNA-binding transcriptional repressor) of toxin-antitoxin stability system
MRSITIEELQADFDAIIDRVENGESFLIHSEHGDAMLIPYSSNEESDDLVRIHTEHYDGC